MSLITYKLFRKAKMLLVLEHHCMQASVMCADGYPCIDTYNILLWSIIALWVKEPRFIIFLLTRELAIGQIPHSCPFATILSICACVKKDV